MSYANLLLNVLYHIVMEMKIRESCLQSGTFIYKPGISVTKQDFHLQMGSLGLQMGFSGYYLPYEVFAVADFNSVMEEFARVKPHLVLMDIRLPFHNGFYWCTEIRKVSKLPMIFVSSMNDNMNLVMAINMGGDDFITKPFDLNVLTVKIQAMLRRTYEFAGESHMLEHQGVWLNLSDGTLTYEEQILELSKNERKILQTLLENPGAIVTRENLMMALWESDVYVDENTLSVNVNRLRRKLETIGLTDFILTRKGIGYQIKNGS